MVDTLTRLLATYGKKRARKLPRIPPQIPISQQQAGPTDGSSLADVSEQNKFQDHESMEQVEYGSQEDALTETEYSHLGRGS